LGWRRLIDTFLRTLYNCMMHSLNAFGDLGKPN
jgi:hypothetical protein